MAKIKFTLFAIGQRPQTSRRWVVYRGKELPGLANPWVEKACKGCLSDKAARLWVAGRHAALAAGALRLAERAAAKPRPELRAGRPLLDLTPRPGLTFGHAIEAYAAHKRIEIGFGLNAQMRQNGKRLRQLREGLGTRPVETIREVDLTALADHAAAGLSNASKNREIIGPGRAVLNYAAHELEWCAPRRIKNLPEQKPAIRSIGLDDSNSLIDAAEPGEQRLVLLWLFRTGMRVSDTLRVVWWDRAAPLPKLGVDLKRASVSLRVGKTQEPEEFELAADLLAALRQIPAEDRHGRLFRWGNKSNLYRDLRPLRERAGIHFTPHVARHTLGATLAGLGTVSLPDLMGIMGHRSVTSTLRYIRSANKTGQRQALADVVAAAAAARAGARGGEEDGEDASSRG